jgi:hypothetical protein
VDDQRADRTHVGRFCEKAVPPIAPGPNLGLSGVPPRTLLLALLLALLRALAVDIAVDKAVEEFSSRGITVCGMWIVCG